MRNSLLLLLVLTSNVFCNSKQKVPPVTTTNPLPSIGNKYSIKGTIRGVDSGWIYFAHEDTTGKMFGRLDSAKVTHGRFEKHGEITEAEKVVVGIPHGKNTIFSPVIFIDTGNLSIELHKDSLSKLVAIGNRAQDEFDDFNKKCGPLVEQSNEAYFKKLRAEEKGDQTSFDSLSIALENYEKRKVALVVEQVKAHPSSIVSAYIVNQTLTVNPEPDVLEPLYKTLSENAKNSIYGRRVLKAIEAGNNTAIGVIAPAFTLPDKSGNKISLSSFRGKYTLIDFWASWCGPCRAENPNLLKAFASFKEKGVTIISISLDDNKRAWLKAVEKDKLLWPQISDLKGSNSEVKKEYGIKAIPMNYLLDKEGRIIAKNLRGGELQKKLREVLL